MTGMVIAGVAVQNVAFHFDKLYDYAVPEEKVDSLQVGCRVMVPFGRGTALRQGLVLSLRSEETLDNPIKTIAAVLDQAPLLDVNMIQLAEYMKERTFCTLFDAVKTMLPAGINLKTMVAYAMAREPSEQEREQLSEEEQQVIAYLSARKGYVKKQAIYVDLGFLMEASYLDDLVNKGLLLRDYDAVRRVGDATVQMVRLLDEFQTEEDLKQGPEKLTAKQKMVAEELLRLGCCSVKELCYFTGVTPVVIKGLKQKGFVECFDQEVFRRPYETGSVKAPEFLLTEEQQHAYDALLKKCDTGETALLFGVTGSGKTNVYLKLINQIHRRGEGIIVMVPEISLTPQTLKLFYSYFGDQVAVFHSGLSAGERLDEWKRVKQGEANIVVGTRSAVFAPLEKVGLIIMDEEQEHTYQSEQSPRYHARDIAKYRVSQDKGLLLLASATPSFESYAAALAGNYALVELPNRYGEAKLPQVEIVDLCKERAAGNQTNISRKLHAELSKNLELGRQSILLLNRRGYNTYAACNSCGSVVTCPNCSISLTYHKSNRRLMCHYCGYSIPFTNVCTDCGAADVRYSGMGTQRIEQELSELFPKARILRMDTDSTMRKFSYDEKLKAFEQGDYDIMIGTQMVAKGLDFENVTLVGVLSADQELFNDDYASLERTFDLITQVVGRSGRGRFPGKAFIQTLTPENPVIRLAAKQDYKSFYQTEILLRKAMVYPPYCTLCSIRFQGTKPERVKQSSFRFMELLREAAAEEPDNVKLIAMIPMPERVFKANGKYRYRLLIKCKNNKNFRALLSRLLIEFSRDRANGGISTVVSMEG